MGINNPSPIPSLKPKGRGREMGYEQGCEGDWRAMRY